MKSRNAHLRLITLALGVAALLVPLAGASTATMQTVQALSVGSALLPCGNPLAASATFETDTRVAVNAMRNPRNIVASWTEGLFLGTIVSVSKDGGETWKQVAVPGHSGCSGDEENTSAADPAVAFDADGMLYVASMNFNFPFPHRERILVSRSLDGGETWEPNRENNAPATVDQYPSHPVGISVPPEPDVSNGELWLTTDPDIPGTAYLVWTRRHRLTTLPRKWETYFSKTTDGGETWTPARSIYQAPEEVLPWNNAMRVMEGRLVNAFLQHDFRPTPEREEPTTPRVQILSIHSDDNGDTWSTIPERVGDTCRKQPRDGEGGNEIFTTPYPSVDLARDGTAYATWHAIRCSDATTSELRVARSTDYGRSWTTLPPIKDDDDQAFLPTLAVAPNGVVGVTYYDLRNDVPGDGRMTVDVWFSHSHDRGESWREEVHLAGPFEASTSPAGLTDFKGLAALPQGFAASFVQAAPAALEPPTDIFFSRLFIPARGDGETTTGGGWLADRHGEKINFGFTAHETVFGFEGDLQLSDKPAGAKIHLTEVTSLGPIGSACGSVEAGPRSLELLGSGTFNGAAASFRVCVQDNGEGANAARDRFFLTCTAGCSYGSGLRAPDDAIDGGNIQVGQGAGESEEPRPATVILDPLLESEASVGEALTFTVRVYDQHQEPLANTSVGLRASTSGGGVETRTGLTGSSGTATIVATSLAEGAEYRASAGNVDSNAIALTPPLP